MSDEWQRISMLITRKTNNKIERILRGYNILGYSFSLIQLINSSLFYTHNLFEKKSEQHFLNYLVHYFYQGDHPVETKLVG